MLINCDSIGRTCIQITPNVALTSSLTWHWKAATGTTVSPVTSSSTARAYDGFKVEFQSFSASLLISSRRLISRSLQRT